MGEEAYSELSPRELRVLHALLQQHHPEVMETTQRYRASRSPNSGTNVTTETRSQMAQEFHLRAIRRGTVIRPTVYASD